MCKERLEEGGQRMWPVKCRWLVRERGAMDRRWMVAVVVDVVVVLMPLK